MQQRPIKFRFIEDPDTPYVKVFPLTEEGIRNCMAQNKDDQHGHTVEEYVARFFLDSFSNIILEQFTGLLDKNGKEIYEGDIVKDDVGIRDVKIGSFEFIDPDGYSHHFHGVYGTWQDGSESSFDVHDMKNQVIIGNIHENPDLLK